MSDERIIELESRIAFQEDSIQSLSQTLRDQQQVIDRMETSIEELRQRLKAINLSPLESEADEPPPPHY